MSKRRLGDLWDNCRRGLNPGCVKPCCSRTLGIYIFNSFKNIHMYSLINTYYSVTQEEF